MDNNDTEARIYAGLVEQVKAEYAKMPAKGVTGDQVSHAIAKRWAAEKGRDFDDPAPPGLPVAITEPIPVTTAVDGLPKRAPRRRRPGIRQIKLPDKGTFDDES